MKNLMFYPSVRNALLVAVAALVSVPAEVIAATPSSASTPTYSSGNAINTATSRDTVADEAGTIPAARPGLPQQNPRGAEGPIREGYTARSGSDASLRDSNPLTMHGLWETKPGNVVTKPDRQ